jgi:lipopolysaccharide assembly outer membrane protein LptD (OstA)
LCGNAAYSQDIPGNTEVNIPADTPLEMPLNTVSDTVSLLPKSQLIDKNEAFIDSVKVDTIVKEKELLTDVVSYYGEDYVYINQKKSQVYLYNKAYIIYEDMRIDAGIIILDYDKNEVYAKGIDSAGIYLQKPKFVQASNEVNPDSIRFNFDSKKALI